MLTKPTDGLFPAIQNLWQLGRRDKIILDEAGHEATVKAMADLLAAVVDEAAA
jgi:hypothetical protein